jgi:two-component system sensor kinase FixL
MAETTGREFQGDSLLLPPDMAASDAAPQQALLEKDFPESVLNMLPGTFFVATPEGRLLRWNRSLEVISEYSAPQIAALHLLDMVVEQDRQRATAAMRAVLEQGSSEIEVDCRARSGRVIPFYVTARRATVGGRTCLVGAGIDITQRRQAEQKLADERNLLRTVIDNIPDAIYVKDGEGRFVLCNREVLRRKGISSQEEIVGRSDFDFYPADLAQSVYADEQQVVRTGQPLVNSERCVADRQTGLPTWNLTTKVPLRSATGEIVGVVGIGRDITERKQAEEAYRTLVDHSLQGLLIVQDMHIVFANRAITDIIGYAAEELLRLPPQGVRELVHQEDQVRVWDQHRRRLEGNFLPERQEFRVIRRDGEVRWVEMHVSRLEYRSRPAIQAACIDVTEKKRAEKSLQELREIINRSPVLVFLWRVAPGQWPVEFVSENVERALGYTADDFLSGRVSWPGITHPDDVPRLEAEVAAHLAAGRRDWSQEYRLITRSGESRWFQDQNLVLLDENGRPARIQSVILDVTERQRMADALCESERKYRDLYEGSRDGTAAGDLTGKLLHANSVFLEMLGYTSREIAGLTCRDITPARWHAEERRIVHEQVLTRGYSDVFEKEYIRKDGSIVPVEVRIHLSRDNEGNPIGTWALVRDITERRKAEAQVEQHLAELTRAWHANTLGEMASGLAHELNQPLCAILNYSNGCLRLTRKEPFALDTLRGSVEQIAAQAQRAADMIKRIRGLTAGREPQRTPLDLEAILRDAVRMLQHEAARNRVAIVVNVAHNLPAIRGDTVEIEQVVLNLLRNALEAMNEARATERVLTISVAPAAEYRVEVAVTDTGRGVPPELAEKIFASFFTTKREGLGIGLSLSRRIVEAHGGRLWVESDGRSGATFRFTLPVEGVGHGEGQSGRVRGG